ncbi:hypothetical protein CO174_03780 [Candidatus Uhrbacteria bacterium CG_4_9_14_3_um_filter_50_9]|uniref:Type 4 fimbrial biogenesis protein PilX N-terminal domain-containing protein n=1 Tax=Candidatus Uhrbacteria bacterium CG_4_9_14_3_um_filter_50_9 TaxID=1975035 RepID=A0A2M7XBR8_9BACT|nr:MAG: hypothetical protein CO174_03780 [Candidatus Uhrbacteria bacterium CG_4_9_14_3_um_filter_50_9]
MFSVHTKFNQTNPQGGYAVIVSVVVIATVLLMLATMSARRVQDASFISLDLGSVTQARALAEGCVQAALLRRSIDSQYVGDEAISVNGSTCTIRPIVGLVIEVEAVAQESVYRLRTTLTSDEPPLIDTWERVDEF